METLYFSDLKDLACSISDRFDELDKENFEDIAVIAKPDEVKEIFKELVCIGYDICDITYERMDWDGYNDEYVLSLNHEGIWLEKFKRENGYYKEEAPVIYVLSNCSSKAIPYCKGKTVYEVIVGEIEDDVDDENEDDEFYYDDCDLNECLHCGSKLDYDEINENGMHGFTAEKSDGESYMRYSLYTTTDLSKADIQSLLQEAGF